jgi:hypothetical protein
MERSAGGQAGWLILLAGQKRSLAAATIQEMTFWLLLVAAFVFGLLAFDAARLSSPAKDVPYSLTAKAWGEDVAHIPLAYARFS